MSKPYQEKIRHVRGVVVGNSLEHWKNVNFTIVSQKLNETQVEYKVSYCSPRDTFIKKEGIRVARESEVSYVVDIKEGSTFSDINFAIITDMVKNREDAPKAHRAYLESIFNSLVVQVQ